MTTLTCVRNDCPLRENGSCLDGIDPPEACPNSSEIDDELAEILAEEASDAPEPKGDEESAEESSPDTATFFGGDSALTLAEADELASIHPCRVILIAGEFESGKSTLAVELYARFLRGDFEGWSFAGSETLIAFDELHRLARLSSGLDEATTERTRHEDMRLLHIELERERERHHLLISDVKGEFFEHVANGLRVADEVPIAARADVCFVLVNGERVADSSTRVLELFRADQLLRGLCAPGGLTSHAEIVIVCSKRDTLPARLPKEIRAELQALQQFCVDAGFNAGFLELSARPTNGDDAEGLAQALSIVKTPAAQVADVHVARDAGERWYWTAEVRANE